MRSIETVSIERHSAGALPTVRDVVAVLFRQRWAAIVAFAAVVLAVAASGVWTPRYEGRMKFLVLRQRTDAVVTASANPPDQDSSRQISEEDLNSEVELLNSEDLLRKVVMASKLAGPGRPSEANIAEAVHRLGKDLKIEPAAKSNVISVRYQNPSPQLVAAVLNELSAGYREKHLELRDSSGELKFFDQQMQQYQQGLNQSQAMLTNFTEGTGVISAERERDSALQQASEFEAVSHHAQAAALETEQRVGALEAQLQTLQPRMTTVVRTSDNPQLLQQLKSTVLNLELKKTELLTKYEPTYRLVQEVDREIAAAKDAISAEESAPIREESSDQNPDYQWTRTEVTKAQAELSGLKARATASASIAAQYHAAAQRLSREGLVQANLLQAAKTQEDNYLLYAHKREEARISDALDQHGILNVVIAEQPVTPALPTRSPRDVALLTLLLAGTFSMSAAFVIDLMDPSFRTPDELTRYLGVPVLAAVPHRET